MGNNSHYSFDAQRDTLSGSGGSGASGFDYDAVDEALAEESNAKPRDCDALQKDDGAEGDISDRALEGFRQTLNFLVDQLIPPGSSRSIDPKTLGVKLLSLLYLANADSFAGASMKAVAERAGLTRQSMSVHVRRFTDAYGFACSWQLSPKRRDALAAGAQARKASRKTLEAAAAKLNEELASGRAGWVSPQASK